LHGVISRYFLKRAIFHPAASSHKHGRLLRRAGRDLVMAAGVEWPRERRNCNTRHNCGGLACLSVTARDIRDIVIEL
jgi:hypothetical protein